MLFVAALLATGALLHGSPASVRTIRGGASAAQMKGAYDFSIRDLKSGEVQELSQYQGSVSLMVNVASK